MSEAAPETPAALPPWLAELSPDDLQFVRRFVLASGSLKAVAAEYGVSYPTVRARLDRLIAKVRAAEDARVRDPFERMLRVLVAEGSLSESLARRLLKVHRETHQAEAGR
jgi:hypothetical protein